jgi:hypothetical protein
MSNVFKEFIRILSPYIEEYFCSTGVVVEVVGDIVYLGASCVRVVSC